MGATPMSNEALEPRSWEKWPIRESLTARAVVAEDEPPAAVAPATPIMNAAALFSSKVDLVVVCTAQGRLAGVLTKSDVVAHLASGGGPADMVDAVMTTDVVTGALDDQVHELWRRMVDCGIKNLPIVGETGAPVAVLTRSRASDLLLASLETEDAMMQDYIAGVGYQ
jgi:arabinose-5-phosphate isomerase